MVSGEWRGHPAPRILFAHTEKPGFLFYPVYTILKAVRLSRYHSPFTIHLKSTSKMLFSVAMGEGFCYNEKKARKG